MDEVKESLWNLAKLTGAVMFVAAFVAFAVIMETCEDEVDDWISETLSGAND